MAGRVTLRRVNQQHDDGVHMFQLGMCLGIMVLGVVVVWMQ